MRLLVISLVVWLAGCQTQPTMTDNMMNVAPIDRAHLATIMDWQDALHFERRIGIGTPLARTKRYVGMTRAQAIDLVISELSKVPSYQAPAWSELGAWNQFDDGFSGFSCGSRANAAYINHLQGDWARHALTSEVPQHERLIFLWHNLFATGYALYQSAHGWARHHEIIRNHAAGTGRSLLRGILESPALLLYLTNDRNYIQNVNENLGREYLELFTLGVGNYRERDLKNLSKVFAGHTVNQVSQQYEYRAGAGSSQAHQVLGQDVKTLDDAVELVLTQPAHSRFWATRFYREYISLEAPGLEALNHMASAYRDSDFQIAALLRATLETPDFWAPQNRYGLVKSPADLLLGAARSTEILGRGENRIREFALSSSRLGHQWVEPPNVAGWPGGMSWLDGDLLERRLAQMPDFFGYELEPELRQALPPLSQYRLVKDNEPAESVYRNRVSELMDNRHSEQLLIGAAVVGFASRELSTRGRGSTEILLKDVWLGDRYWSGMRFRFTRSREHSADLIRLESGDCAPDCLSVYNMDRPDRRRGQLKFRTAWPSRMRNDGYGRLPADERLLIRRLAELPHYLESSVLRNGRIQQGNGKNAEAWTEYFDRWRERVPKEELPTGQPSIAFLVTNGGHLNQMCAITYLNAFNTNIRGWPDQWQGHQGVSAQLADAGLGWDEFLLPGLPSLHIGSADSKASIITRLSQDGYQLK